MTRKKSVAIFFAILFLLYYQEWILVLFFETTSKFSSLLLGTSSNSSFNKLLSSPKNGGQSFSSIFSESNSNDQKHGAKDLRTNSVVKSISSKPKSPVQVKEPQKKKNGIMKLSDELQSQLTQLQYIDNDNPQYSTFDAKKSRLNSFCNRPRMKCGPPISCELGCQIHHFVSCLLIAYATNRTLIPDFKFWPKPNYKKNRSNGKDDNWNSIFKPFLAHEGLFLKSNSSSTNCPNSDDSNRIVDINSDISTVSWTNDKVELCTRDILEYPFLNGVLPVPYEIGMKLKKVGISSPFQWWIGEFVKFITRLEPKLEQRLVRLRKQFLLLQKKNKVPTVGILIRRRDKLGEKKKANYSLDKYMTVVKKYFSKYESLITTPTNFTRRIYLATDDAGLLILARKQYPKPKWDFLTFEDKFSETEELVRDMFLLRECDLILCSFSSDLCRLISELMETKFPGASSHVKSLDYKYFFDVPDFKNKNKLRIVLQ